jgi:hypothetical protein
LRDTGGIYLVRVKRYVTGNIHNAVGPEFILQAGDILYFTGLVESFATFCEEHGLELITNEVETNAVAPTTTTPTHDEDDEDSPSSPFLDEFANPTVSLHELVSLPAIPEGKEPLVGTNIENHQSATAQEKLRTILSMEDAIHEIEGGTYLTYARNRIIVAQHDDLVIVAIDARDRSGLIMDISKMLSKHDLELQHTEAAVRGGDRSLSIWRCHYKPQLTEEKAAKIWSDFYSLLNKDPVASKAGGSRVVRAIVKPGSRLVGHTAAEIKFSAAYKAAIVSSIRSLR